MKRFIKEAPTLLLLIAIPVALWTAIFAIQVAIGHFMPPIMVGAVAAISGVCIGSYISNAMKD